MGPYCKFCDRRCFVPRVLGNGRSMLLATCPAGMEHDREQTGEDHSTATNPAAEQAPALRLDGVNLSEPAARALNTIRTLTGDTRTAAVNKALTAYALVLSAQHAGGSVTVQASPNAEADRIRFY